MIINKKILALAPHFDDIELGCFATLHKLSSDNEIYYVGFSYSTYAKNKKLIDESVTRSVNMLSLTPEHLQKFNYDPRDFDRSRNDILQNLYDLNKKIRPDLVIIPASSDIHQAHQVLHKEAVRIFKKASLWGYEMPWNNYTFNPHIFVPISPISLKQKLKATSSFPSHGKSSFMENGILKDLASLRGKQIGRQYAESFELIRQIIE